MSRELAVAAFAVVVLAGCASVPMESPERSAEAKKFAPPAEGNAGVYVYRLGGFGSALTKSIWIDGKCIGKSAPSTFFYEEVKGNAEHTISTESEFSPNDLQLPTVAGTNYFVHQYIKMGVFVGGANLELVSEEEGKKQVAQIELAKKGDCGK